MKTLIVLGILWTLAAYGYFTRCLKYSQSARCSMLLRKCRYLKYSLQSHITGEFLLIKVWIWINFLWKSTWPSFNLVSAPLMLYTCFHHSTVIPVLSSHHLSLCPLGCGWCFCFYFHDLKIQQNFCNKNLVLYTRYAA